MHVIAVASSKGGVGKTTISGHIAVEAQRKSIKPVILLDTDPQASLKDWWDARTDYTPHLASVALDKLPDNLPIWRGQGVALVVIDTPPAIADNIRAVISSCDLVVIPTRPSPHDLRAIGRTVEIANACGKPMVFVINGAAHRARITTAAVTELSQHGAVAPSILHQRTDFATAMISGSTVQESYPAGKSAREVEDLWAYLHKLLLLQGSRSGSKARSARSAA